MGLLICHDCKNEVSTEAKACPKCGAKARKPMSRSKKWLLGFAGFAMFLGIAVTSQNERSAATEKAAALAARTPEQIAVAKAKDAHLQIAGIGLVQLKNAMKDPASFELKKLYVTKTGYACYTYRAMNSFGAKLPFTAVSSPDGKMLLEEKNESQFSKVWNRECTKDGGDDITQFVNRLIS